MAILKVTEQVPKEYCSQEFTVRLNNELFDTDGQIGSLEKIIDNFGYNKPCEWQDEYGRTYFGFILIDKETKKQYTRLYLEYVNALANEILLLREFKMI